MGGGMTTHLESPGMAGMDVPRVFIPPAQEVCREGDRDQEVRKRTQAQRQADDGLGESSLVSTVAADLGLGDIHTSVYGCALKLLHRLKLRLPKIWVSSVHRID